MVVSNLLQQDPEVADLLRATKRVIHEEGWAQGPTREHGVCLEDAILDAAEETCGVVAASENPVVQRAAALLQHLLGIDSYLWPNNQLWYWQDDPRAGLAEIDGILDNGILVTAGIFA